MKPWIKKIAGFGLASFFGDFSHEMTISFVPMLVQEFVGMQQAPFFLGIISSFTDSFASFFRLFSGYLTDRISRKKPLIVTGYALAALFSTLVGFAHSVWSLLMYRTLSFIGSGLREPPRDALIATIIGPRYYGRAFGLRNAMDTIGALIGPLIAFICVGVFSIRSIFLLSFIPGILAAFAIIFFTPDVRINPRQHQKKFSTFWQDFMQLPKPFVIFLGILTIFDVTFFNKLLILSRAQQMITGTSFATAQLLVLLYAIFNTVRACCEFLIGILSDYSNRIILLAFLGCGTIVLVALLLIKSQASLLYCVGIFALFAVTNATMTTLKKACAADMLPAEVRGIGYGVLQAAEGFSALIGNALIGFLWTNYSPTLAFSYVATFSSIAMLFLLLFAIYQRKNISTSNPL